MPGKVMIGEGGVGIMVAEGGVFTSLTRGCTNGDLRSPIGDLPMLA